MIHIFITGASTGLGLSLYNALNNGFNSKNFQITVIGRHLPNSLKKKDFFLFSDLSSNIQFKNKIKKNATKVIFLSNAGIIDPINSADKINRKLLKRNYNINFFSPFIIASQLAKNSKLKKLKLHIINISSGASSKAIAGWSPYCSSKAAIKMALDCIATENNHVTVDHINPASMNTNMQKKIRFSEKKNMLKIKYFTNLHKRKLLKKPELAAIEIMNKIKKYLI